MNYSVGLGTNILRNCAGVKLALTRILVNKYSCFSLFKWSQIFFEKEIELKLKSVAGVDQTNLVDPLKLADENSLFLDIEGTIIHHKVSNSLMHNQECSSQSNRVKHPAILLHGFASSTFSWEFIQKPMPFILGQPILSFDRPAFGLTSRPEVRIVNAEKKMNPYSTEFAVHVGFKLSEKYFSNKKFILIAHSLGSWTAVQMYFKAPEKISAIIFVDPCLFAPLAISRNEIPESSGKWHKIQESIPSLFANLYKQFSPLQYYICLLLTKVIRSKYFEEIVATFFDLFGLLIIRFSWFDQRLITKEIENAYTKPLGCKNWKAAIIEWFISFAFDENPKFFQGLQSLRKINCPVLIVSGDEDPITPKWNSQLLEKIIPDAKLDIIGDCGHIPQEEKPDALLLSISKFVQNLK